MEQNSLYDQVNRSVKKCGKYSGIHDHNNNDFCRIKKGIEIERYRRSREPKYFRNEDERRPRTKKITRG